MAKSLRDKLYGRKHLTLTTDRRTGKSMVVPTGAMVEEVVLRIPSGRVATIETVRTVMAAEAGTEIACPLVTGIMLRLLAELEQQEGTGAPWWRVVRDGGKINPKFPDAPFSQIHLLEKEGVVPQRHGRSWVVPLERYGVGPEELTG